MYSNIYSRIKELCKANKITIRKLEETLGFGNSSINKWKGSVSPSIDKVIKVADYFDVSIDYLTGVSDTPCSLTKFLEDEYLASLIDAVNDMTDEEKNNMSQVLKISFPRVFKKEEATK